MAKTRSVVAAVVLSALVVLLTVTAMVTRLQRAISDLGSNVDRIALTLEERRQDGLQSDLQLLKEKLSELRGAQRCDEVHRRRRRSCSLAPVRPCLSLLCRNCARRRQSDAALSFWLGCCVGCAAALSVVGGMQNIHSLVSGLKANESKLEAATAVVVKEVVVDPEAARAQEDFQAYTREELAHIGTMLEELKIGFAQCVIERAVCVTPD